jgi:hypothetical protein
MADSASNKGNFERVGESVGSVTGKAADTAVDIMSSMVRTAASTIGGWWSRSAPDDMARSFGREQEDSCRQHFEQKRREGRTRTDYDAVRPLYHFGHLAGSNPDYQGRSFEEVEGDLQRTWTPEYTTAFGEWNNVREYINTGYSANRNTRGGNLP